MYIISSFKHSMHIEMAIASLESIGVAREKILAVPLEVRKQKEKLFDSIHKADGISLFDTAAVCASIFMVLGVIYGYVLPWGPILCGLAGLLLGGITGFIIDQIPKRKGRRKAVAGGSASEVVIIVNCGSDLAERAESILWDHLALGVAQLEQV